MAIEALVFPYKKGQLVWPKEGSRLLFLNAEASPELKSISVVAVQPRYDLALPFIQSGDDVLADAELLHEGPFDTVWVLPGKDLQETQYLLARAVRSAHAGGIVMAAAPNNAGGKRLEELFLTLGLSPSVESKNRARIAFASVDAGWNKEKTTRWIENGQEQPVMDGTVLSRPGLHSWDRIDDGSALLARHLPADLSGAVADFGCGWGYLSLQASERSTRIKRLTLADIDARAVSLAKINVQKRHPALPVETVWTDLAQPGSRLGPFDAILLNPPFHEGTHAVPSLGQAMIATAARSLAPPGRLYLVANRHLPYEKTLRAEFSRVDLLAEENGFKAFVCRL